MCLLGEIILYVGMPPKTKTFYNTSTNWRIFFVMKHKQSLEKTWNKHKAIYK